MGIPEFVVIPPLLVTSLAGNLRHHLLHLQLYNRVLGILLAVKPGKNLGGFFMSIVGNEPPRLFPPVSKVIGKGRQRLTLSGRKKTKISTMPLVTIWIQTGILHPSSPGMNEEP